MILNTSLFYNKHKKHIYKKINWFKYEKKIIRYKKKESKRQSSFFYFFNNYAKKFFNKKLKKIYINN